MPTMTSTLHTVKAVRHLTPHAYVLQLERNDLEFMPGQYVKVGRSTDDQRREYSVYSPPHSEDLEVLIKVFPNGHVSSYLQHMQPGEQVAIDGKAGNFLINENDVTSKKFTFIGTSTGISPFHCFVQSYPDLDYQILHGARYAEERFEYERYPKERYTACVSRGHFEGFNGRVTDYLKDHPPHKEDLFYLCGNVDMIYSIIAMLRDMDIPRKQVKTEVYF